MKAILRGIFGKQTDQEISGYMGVEDLSGTTYATFKNSVVEVDLRRYFKTQEGKEAREKVASSGPQIGCSSTK